MFAVVSVHFKQKRLCSFPKMIILQYHRIRAKNKRDNDNVAEVSCDDQTFQSSVADISKQPHITPNNQHNQIHSTNISHHLITVGNKRKTNLICKRKDPPYTSTR